MMRWNALTNILLTSLYACLVLSFVTHTPQVIGPKFLDINEGGRAEFQCTITDYDGSSVSWLHDGSKLRDEKNVHIEFYDSKWLCYEQSYSNESALSKLIIYPARPVDDGIYYCEIATVNSQPVYLHILPSPQSLSVGPHCFPSGVFVVASGSRIKIRCWIPNSPIQPVNNLTWNDTANNVSYQTDSTYHYAVASVIASDDSTGAIFMCRFDNGVSQAYCLSGPMLVHHPSDNFCLVSTDSYFTTPLLYDVSFIQQSVHVDLYQWSCYERQSYNQFISNTSKIHVVVLQSKQERHYIICTAVENPVNTSIISTETVPVGLITGTDQTSLRSDPETIPETTFTNQTPLKSDPVEEVPHTSQLSSTLGLSVHPTDEGQMPSIDVTDSVVTVSDIDKVTGNTGREVSVHSTTSHVQVKSTFFAGLSATTSARHLTDTHIMKSLPIIIGCAGILTLAVCLSLCIFWRKRMESKKKRLDKFKDSMWLSSKRPTIIVPTEESSDESRPSQHQEEGPYIAMTRTSVSQGEAPPPQDLAVVEVHQVEAESESVPCSQVQGEGTYMDMTQVHGSSADQNVFTFPRTHKTLLLSNMELSSRDHDIRSSSVKMLHTLKRHQSMKEIQRKVLERKSSLPSVVPVPMHDCDTLQMQVNPLNYARKCSLPVHVPELIRERGESSASNQYMDMSKLHLTTIRGPSYVNTGLSRAIHVTPVQTESENMTEQHGNNDAGNEEQHGIVHHTYMDAVSLKRLRSHQFSDC